MEKALIIGNSGGIGAAIEQILVTQGCNVTGLSRSGNGLDVTDEQSVAAHLAAEQGGFDLILVATGALEINGAVPEKSMKALSSTAIMDQMALNAAGPAIVLKHAMPLLHRNRWSVFAALSARVGSIGDNRLGGWVSYRASKAALNQIIRTASIQLARSHPLAICVALHPGTVQTSFTEKYLGRHPSVPASQAAANLISVVQGLSPTESGGFYDWSGKQVPW